MTTDGITITFTDGDSYAAVFGALEGWTVKIEFSSGNEAIAVIRTASAHHGLLVADADVNGSPLPGEDARTWLDFDSIAQVTIL